uniref:Uncharacterized protein n=1 Tax=viral metagenome TaxID=1070528 RepID=A0A6M3JJU7_9ZZZZ
MDPAIEQADRYMDDYELAMAAPAARDAEPGAHKQEDGPGPGLASHDLLPVPGDPGGPRKGESDPLGERDAGVTWMRRMTDMGNRLHYWAATGDDRAFSAPGPWRSA